jgi:serine protease Do
VKVLRDGAPKTVQINVGRLPGQPFEARARQPEPSDTEALKGVGVTDLDARTRRQFGIPPHIQGALVVEVEPGSASAAAGLKPGDVILEINRSPVRNAQDAVRLTQNPKRLTTLVRIWSHGQIRYLVVDESKSD